MIALALAMILTVLTPYSGSLALYGHTDSYAAHCYRTSQVTQTNTLTVTAVRKTRTCNGKRTYWDSGFAGSRESNVYFPLYGTIKIRATLPARAPGIWPALWLRHRNGASTGEVDLMEVFAGGKDAVSQHLHFPNTAGTGVWGKGVRTLSPGPHTYWVRIVPVGSATKFTVGVDSKTTGTYTLKNSSKLRNVNKSKAWDVAANIAVSRGKYTGDWRKAKGTRYTMKVHSIKWSK